MRVFIIKLADFVLVVCTKLYNDRVSGKAEEKTGFGATWEGAIITQELYQSKLNNSKFVPVVLAGSDIDHIPTILRGMPCFDECERALSLAMDAETPSLYYLVGHANVTAQMIDHYALSSSDASKLLTTFAKCLTNSIVSNLAVSIYKWALRIQSEINGTYHPTYVEALSELGASGI